VQRVLDATQAFFEQLTSVDLVPLLIAVGIHLLKIAATSRAWRNVLAAAYPEERVSWPKILASYCAGVGVNAVVPVRAGDLVRLYLAHRAVPHSTYPTLASSMLVMSIFDLAVSGAFLLYAISLGVLPGLDVLPSLPGFPFGWLVEHEWVTLGIVVGLTLFFFFGGIWAGRHVRNFWQRIGQGFTVLRTPARYLRTVASWQAVEWGLRLATIWFLLDAFDIDQSVQNVLLVQVAMSLATVVPVTPAGIGTEQALLLYVFRGAAPRSQLLAFSVGMKLTVSAVNLVVGVIAIAVTLRTVRIGRAIDAARAHEAAQEVSEDRASTRS
jgi:uncharacterized membrane protein YbhN (UPF0104 family)